MSSEPVITQFLRGTNFAVRTGKSHTSNVFTRVCVSWFQILTWPWYSEQSIHGSVGWRSTLFTLSDLAVSFRLMSNLRG
ncbi:hypothetical protein ALC57_09103 [Trachymyrmex cornetzi]|uniref:Uncharacterized protein n=1 Tax=Trachymyrmex cornetzi TaxID=471704 RepID=A0A151J5V4_9HYME|nr:hypothetical protein ALC57_09103 [Trachymyrmex cornetzi]